MGIRRRASSSALGKWKRCWETPKVAFQALASGASDAQRRADSGLPGPPCHPTGNDASPVCHLDSFPDARNPSGLGEEREIGTLGVAWPTKAGQKEKGKMGQLLRPSPVSSASASILNSLRSVVCGFF